MRFYLGRVVIGGSKWPLRGSHRQKWRCEIEGRAAAIVRQAMVDAGASSDVAMRARGRWPPPATGAIVGNGDAAARRARHGRLGIVGCGDARARRKNRLRVSGRQVCMRFREEETAPAIRGGKPRGLMCSSATLAGFSTYPMRAARRGRCSICCCFFSTCFCSRCCCSSRGTVAKLAMRAAFCLIQRPYISKLCLPGAFRPGITIIKC